MAVQGVIIDNLHCSEYTWANYTQDPIISGDMPDGYTFNNILSDMVNLSGTPSVNTNVKMYENGRLSIWGSKSKRTSPQMTYFSIDIRVDNTISIFNIASPQLDSYPGNPEPRVGVAFAIDDSTEKAYIAVGYYPNYPTWGGTIRNCPISDSNRTLLYNVIKGLLPVPYNWQSVPSISGKNGISLLSHVRDDSILTGQDISNLTPAQVKLEGTTQISSLIANVPIGKAVKAIYAGKVDFLGIMKDNSASSTVRISVAGNNVYLASFISQKN